MSSRKLNKRILILCEGVTERLYASSLKNELPRQLQRSISIEIGEAEQQDPLNLVKEAVRKVKKARKEKNPYEEVWLFFDHDNWPQLRDAFGRAWAEGFKVAFTSICLEHWFILHFEDCGRSFPDGSSALSYLRKLWPAYHKTRLNHYRELKQHLTVAIERSDRIGRWDSDLPLIARNPYCSIPHLIRFFEGLKDEG